MSLDFPIEHLNDEIVNWMEFYHKVMDKRIFSMIVESISRSFSKSSGGGGSTVGMDSHDNKDTTKLD